MENSLWAIVTGTSSGLGAALAGTLLDQGWQVLGIARRTVHFGGSNYHHLQADLSDVSAATESIRSFWEQLRPARVKRLGLVNNAATLGPIGILKSLEMEQLQQCMDLNLTLPMWLMSYFWEQGRTEDYRVINLSSGAAYNPYAGWGGYCTTKAGLLMCGKVMALDWEHQRQQGHGPRQTAVVAFAPGVLDTPMQDQVRNADQREFPALNKFIKLKEDGSLVDPQEPAKVITQLLSADHLQPVAELRFGDSLAGVVANPNGAN